MCKERVIRLSCHLDVILKQPKQTQFATIYIKYNTENSKESKVKYSRFQSTQFPLSTEITSSGAGTTLEAAVNS